MTSVQTWAGALCCVVLAASVVQYFLPKKPLARSVSLVLGVILLLAMLAPLAGFLRNTDWEIPIQANETLETDSYLEETNRQILKLAEKNITAETAKALQKEGISFDDIQVFMDTDADNCIVLNKILITVPVRQSANTEGIREKVEKMFRVQTEVQVHG